MNENQFEYIVNIAHWRFGNDKWPLLAEPWDGLQAEKRLSQFGFLPDHIL